MRLFNLLLLALFVGVVSNLTAQGNCNDEDLAYIAANLDFVTTTAADCGVDCVFAGNPQQCFDDCFSAQVPLSASCVGCFSAQTDCATDNCLLVCAFGSEAECSACIEANCLADFNACAGITDNDNDGETSLFDCDDNNPNINTSATEIWYDGVDQNCDGLNDFDQDQDGDPSVDFGGTDCDDQNPATFGDATTWFADADMDGFGDSSNSTVACVQPTGFVADNTDCNDTDATIFPGAPGTASGDDNNCNGVIDPDEVLVCVGDLNNDLSVGTPDLLILLSDLGCIVDCTADFDENGNVNSADLLVFLGNFGAFCD
jgi:hypothetical protein